MKRLSYIFLSLGLVLVAGTTAFAQQNLRTGYFLDGYAYKYRINPAVQGERGFVQIPAIPSLSVGVESNLGLATVLYPTQDGGLTTFLNSSVSADEFLSKLNKNNLVTANVGVDLLSFGFRYGQSYHTVDLSVKVDAGVSLPKDIFTFLKQGTLAQDVFNLKNIGVRASSYIELAYGYSHTIGDNISVGGRAKFLWGLAGAKARISNLDLVANEEEWRIKGNGNIMFNVPGIYLQTRSEAGMSNSPEEDDLIAWSFEEIDPNNILNDALKHPKNFGCAFDLGVTWDFMDYFTLSASVTDLGFISWGKALTAEMTGEEFYYDGLGEISTTQKPDNTVENQFADMGDELLAVTNFKKTGHNKRINQMLACSSHLGLEFRMPFYERWTVGLLGTHRFDGQFSYTEGRLATGIAPLNWLSLTCNYGISEFGHSFGGMLNIHAKGFNFFLGCDSFVPLFHVTPQFIPIYNANTNLGFGILFSFGKNHGRYVSR